MGIQASVEVPKTVQVHDKRLFILQCSLHLCFSFAAIAQIFALTSWAEFDKPTSVYAMWTQGDQPELSEVPAELCTEIARGLRGMKHCLDPPYFNVSEQRWKQRVSDWNYDCGNYIAYQGTVQTFWQQDQNTKCIWFYPPMISVTKDSVSFTLAAQETPFTCSSGSRTSCVQNFTLPDKRLTIYPRVEDAIVNIITTVWGAGEQVIGPRLTLKDQNDKTMLTYEEGEVTRLTLGTILQAAGITLDQLNPMMTTDPYAWAPSYRFSGMRLVAKMTYKNLKPWSISSDVQVEMKVDALASEWSLHSDGFQYDPSGTSGNWDHTSTAAVQFITEGEIGHFTMTALLNALLNAVVMVGMVSVVMNLYLRNFHYWIIALQPKNLSEPLDTMCRNCSRDTCECVPSASDDDSPTHTIRQATKPPELANIDLELNNAVSSVDFSANSNRDGKQDHFDSPAEHNDEHEPLSPQLNYRKKDERGAEWARDARTADNNTTGGIVQQTVTPSRGEQPRAKQGRTHKVATPRRSRQTQLSPRKASVRTPVHNPDLKDKDQALRAARLSRSGLSNVDV